MKTLLLYATKSGAARECAELLAKELTDCTVCDLRHAIPNPELFDTIIVGSGIRFGKIYKPAAKFTSNIKMYCLLNRFLSISAIAKLKHFRMQSKKTFRRNCSCMRIA